MDRNAFFNLIKENRLSSAYLLHGVEEYVKDSAVSALLETVEEATRPLNVDTLESAEANALTLACDALPFFAKRRVVICRAMPKDSDAKAILAYLPKMPEGKMLLYGVLLYSNVYEDLMHSMLLRPDHLRDDIFCWQIQTTSNLRQRLGYAPDKHG